MRAQLTEVHRINPAFTVEWPVKFLPYKRREDLDILIEGLRRAGLQG